MKHLFEFIDAYPIIWGPVFIVVLIIGWRIGVKLKKNERERIEFNIKCKLDQLYNQKDVEHK